MSGGMIDDTQVIEVRNVQQQFKVGEEIVVALREVDFSIQANSFNIIYGPSGSGKSTLLDILAGLQAPSVGKVIVEGRDIFAHRF